MPTICCVPFCTSQSPKISFFKIPKAKVEIWSRAIPRTDRKLTPKDSVCEKHFFLSQIIRELKTECYTIPLGQPKLAPEAVPSVFPNCPSYLSKKEIKKRRPIIKHKIFKIKRRKITENDNDVTINEEIYESPNNNSPLAVLFENLNLLQLPTSWLINKVENIIIIYDFYTNLNCNAILKKKIILSNTEIKCYVFDELFNVNNILEKPIETIPELQDFLNKFNKLKVCLGGSIIPTSSTKNVLYKNDMILNTSRHQRCLLVLNESIKINTCKFCKNSKKIINNLKSRKLTFTKEERNKTFLQIKQRAKRLKQQNDAVKIELQQSKKEINILNNQDFFNKIEMLENIPSSQKLLIKTCVETSRCSKKTSRRYQSDWLLVCLLLHIKSPTTYKFLRLNNIMPLPAISTVRKYLSRVKLKCGLDECFFEAFKMKIETKTECERRGVLMFDEMAVRQSVELNVTNMKLMGVQDFGENNTYTSTDVKDKMADHALVFLWSSILTKFTQPVAAYAAKGPTSGVCLAKLLLAVIKKLEESGAKVDSVVCDGASTNRKMWSEFGITGKMKNVVNKITHPNSDSRHLYFFSDVPHLFKCSRNRFKKSRKLKTPEGEANWRHYEIVFDLDQKRANNLRICPKLSELHLNPNNFMKMRVKLATQIFSNSMVAGLQYYKEHSNLLSDIEGTVRFTKRLNDLFDVMNRRYPAEGIRIGSKDFLILEDNLKFLDEWERMLENGEITKDQFLTPSTSEGFRVSIKSTIELTNYLLQEQNFKYVLTSRMNQDSLEVSITSFDLHHGKTISFLTS